VTAKAGEEGKLFGSVTAADIAKELEARTGTVVDRRTVHLAEPIRSVGTHEVTIRLHPEVEAAVTVEVAAE
jgi:large subunit ribosomal protein L9